MDPLAAGLSGPGAYTERGALRLAQDLAHPFTLAHASLDMRRSLHQLRREEQVAQERRPRLP